MDAVHSGITEDALMALGPDARVEVIDGHVIEMATVSVLHQLVIMNIFRALDQYVRPLAAGEVFLYGLYFVLRRQGAFLQYALVPDVTYLRGERLLHEIWNLRYGFPGAPDLAVEVMSPDDKAELILLRTRRYLEAGTEQVWVVYPESRELHQYRRGEAVENVRVYRDNELVEADALFLGLQLNTADIFRLPPWVEERLKSDKPS